MKILPVVMCGGAGTRVWPESRESLPKQFIPLVGKRSTFQDTIDMLANDLFDTPIVISNVEYRFLVAEQLEQIGRPARIVLEPTRRDSGPAVAVAAALAAQVSPDTVVAVLAADHVVRDRRAYVELCRQAAEAATAGHIVTLGIRPTEPTSAYGYIRTGAPVGVGRNVMKVDAFVEKPDAATAKRYVAEQYLWNSGNFFFKASVMQEELQHFEPVMSEAVAAAVENAASDLDFLVLDAPRLVAPPRSRSTMP